MSQVPPFQEMSSGNRSIVVRRPNGDSLPAWRLLSPVRPSRRLLYETLEARQLLSVANSAQQQTLADLPVAAQEAVSAAMTREQSAYPSVQEAKLTASGGAAGDNSGFSVAISGSTVVVGAPWATVDDHSQQGAAYIFTESGSVWTQAAELTASDGHSDDGFGYSVAISGNTVVVGSDVPPQGGGLRVHETRLRLDQHDPDRQAQADGAARTTLATRFRSLAKRWWSERRRHQSAASVRGRPTCSRSPAPLGLA